MSADQEPDAALMLRVKQGESIAFALLVDRYKQPVMNLVYRMLHDATEVRRGPNRFRPGLSLGPSLRTIG